MSIPRDQAEKILEKLYYLMSETESLLSKNENLTKLNKSLISQIYNNRNKKLLTQDEYNFLIDMVVINQIHYEEELYSHRKFLQLKGSLGHECPF